MGFAKLAAGRKASLFEKFCLLAGQFIGFLKPKHDADARLLPYATWDLLKRINSRWAITYKLWTWVLTKQYPRGVIELWEMYFQDLEHPMRKDYRENDSNK